MLHPSIPVHLEQFLSDDFKLNLSKQQRKQEETRAIEDAQEILSDSEKADACLRSILSKKNIPEGLQNENLEIFPGYVQVRPDVGDGDQSYGSNPSLDYVHNLRDHVNESGQSVNVSPRGKIQTFSKSSRKRMIKTFAALEEMPKFALTLTFADDTMSGKSITERAEFSTKTFRYLTQWINNHTEFWAIWKREWEERKSGVLQGELCPHYHLLIGGAWDGSENELTANGFCGPWEKSYIGQARKILTEWVRFTGTEDPAALHVAMHEKSYAWLDNARHANKYISKYMAKLLDYDLSEEESLGRFWGKIGGARMPLCVSPELITLCPEVALRVRRYFRRYVSRSGKNATSKKIKGVRKFGKSFRDIGRGTFVLISRETILRLVEYVEETFLNELVEGI